MARYLLVKVMDNKKAEALVARLDGVEGVGTVGLFASPLKFCDGCDQGDSEIVSVKSYKWGTWHCPICKLPKSTANHTLRNLLEDKDLPVIFRDCNLTIKEPYTNEPVKKYGKLSIDSEKVRIEEGAVRMDRYRRKQRRGL